MSNMSQFSEKYLSLLSPSVSSTLASIKTTAEEHESKCSAFPSTPSSIPAFLDQKILFLDQRCLYLQEYRLALSDLRQAQLLLSPDYHKERTETAIAYCASAEESTAIKFSKKIITEDILDALRHINQLKDAYRDVMSGRAVDGSALQERSLRLGGLAIKKETIAYYDGREQDSNGIWCLIKNFYCCPEDIKAAYLVPNVLGSDTVRYIFGGDVASTTDVRNTLLLDEIMVARLNLGDIVVVPVAGQDDEWQCLVTRPEKRNDFISGMRSLSLGDFHKKRLRFLSAKRPAKRYLFFRFLITYLQLASEGNLEWAADIEKDFEGWLSPGKYLRRSALPALGRLFCGNRGIPTAIQELCDRVTFTDDEELSSETEPNERAVHGLSQLLLHVNIPRRDTEVNCDIETEECQACRRDYVCRECGYDSLDEYCRY